jgi:hypothetical protein
MTTALWIASGLLAVIMIGAGLEKLFAPIEQLRLKRPWTQDADPRFVRVLGAIEVLGGAGLILPAVTGIAPHLVPVAAASITLLLVSAIAVEARRRAPVARVALPAFALALALLVAVGRFGPYPL